MTTAAFLSSYGFESLRDLPDMDQLEAAGLLGKEKWLSGSLPGEFKLEDAPEETDEGFETDAAFDD